MDNLKTSASERQTSRGILKLFVAGATLLLASLGNVAQSQQASSVVSSGVSKPATVSDAKPASSHYRIGPGDVLDIRVFNRPQFSRDGVRVDGRGMIRMPLIEGEIQAACRTEEELSTDLTSRYKEYLRSPQVDVFIKEYQSQPVAVIGAVRTPSRFQLQRRVRLLELLTFAGGPAENAGRTVQVVHSGALPVCDGGALIAQPVSDETSTADYYRLSETLKGAEAANPYLRTGDIVSIAEADQVYVVGNVLRPSSIPLKEPITVTRAIAMVGGTMPDTKSDKVRIVRQAAGSAVKTEIFVDLKAIDKHQAEDIALQANDIVDVPTSGGKRFLRSLISTVAPTVGQLPVRVIP